MNIFFVHTHFYGTDSGPVCACAARAGALVARTGIYALLPVFSDRLYLRTTDDKSLSAEGEATESAVQQQVCWL